jgi:hypothetical protein
MPLRCAQSLTLLWVAGLAFAVAGACGGPGGGPPPAGASDAADAADAANGGADSLDGGAAADAPIGLDLLVGGGDALPDGGSADVARPPDTRPSDLGPADQGHADPGGADPGPADAGLADPGPPDAALPDPGLPHPDAPGPAPPGPADVLDVPDAPDGSGAPAVDCAALPPGPFPLVKLQGPIASEDLAFDRAGNVVGSNDQAIFKSSYGGSPQVWVPKLDFRAGMRFLPSGHLIVADDTKGEIVRVDPDGVKVPIMTGLSYPNGITVDMAGMVYFSEHDADTVWRLHPFTGDATVITTAVANPNGLTFSPDFKTLYIGGFNGDPVVWAVSISPAGVPGKLVPFASFGTGWHDGMGVDVCGNLYVADYEAPARIYRVSPDGQTATVIIDASSLPNAYLPNLQWGSGLGGWDAHALYLPDGWNKGVFEVVIGVPGKATPYP